MSNLSQAIAQRFVRARLAAEALSDYPGDLPASLEAAYAIQDQAIALWPHPVAGWKVGRIASPWLERFGGEDRLVGPIFRPDVRTARAGEVIEFPAFVGGTACVEAEFVFRLATDVPADKLTWTPQEAAALVGAMHIAVEPAGSPLLNINARGPAVVISDFGNNAGLILGPEIPGWRERPFETLTTETFIDDRSVGKGSAASLPGGPLTALAFALSRNARRGRPLQAQELISTGATTGIHDIQAGQNARVSFGALGEFRCLAVPARKQ